MPKLRGMEGRRLDILSIVPNLRSPAHFSNSHSESYNHSSDPLKSIHIGSVYLVGTPGSSTVSCVNRGWPYQKQDDARHCSFVFPKSKYTQTQQLQQISTVKHYFIAFTARGPRVVVASACVTTDYPIPKGVSVTH